MNIKETDNILDDAMGGGEVVEALFEKAKSNLHIRNTVSFISKLTDLTNDNDNDNNSHLVALEILSGTNSDGIIDYLRVNIIYKDHPSNKVLNTSGIAPKNNSSKFELLQSLAGNGADGLFPEFLPEIDNCIITVELSSDSNNNSEKILNALLSSEQKKELEFLLLDNQLSNKKSLTTRKMKL